MELLQEFVAARVNMSDAEREARERELLRRMHERTVVTRWIDAVRARRTVRAARGQAQRTPQAAPVADAAAPARDLADARR